jgi:LmbE family N-acetylglucosaminyl deacetylase
MEIGTVDKPKVVLIVGAHPDDTEFACGGTVARWTEQGCDVHYLVCTTGDKGSKDLEMTIDRLTVLRQVEQREAARRLGVTDITFMGEPDGEFDPNLTNRERIARKIRELQPDTLMVHDPWRRYQLHPDHRNVGFCTLDGMVAARDHLYVPNLMKEGLMPFTVPQILLYGTDDATAWVDISSTLDRKVDALRAHESQVNRIPDLKGRMVEWASRVGQLHGLELAEEFHLIEQK